MGAEMKATLKKGNRNGPQIVSLETEFFFLTIEKKEKKECFSESENALV